MSLYEELVTKSQWNFMRYQMLYRRGQTAYELTNKPELPYGEAIDQMVAWVKDADVVVVGGVAEWSCRGLQQRRLLQRWSICFFPGM